MSDIELERWRPKFKKGEAVRGMFIASSNSGKSFCLRYLLRRHLIKKFDFFIVFCNNYEELEKYADYLPDESTILAMKFDGVLINKIKEENQLRASQGKPMLNTLIILDDTIGKEVKNSSELQDVYCTGRHNSLSCIAIFQRWVLSSTDMRNNSSFVVFLKNNSASDRRLIAKDVLESTIDVPDDVNDKKFYTALMRRYMSRVGDCLVVDNEAKSENPDELPTSLRYFRAPDNYEELLDQTIEEIGVEEQEDSGSEVLSDDSDDEESSTNSEERKEKEVAVEEFIEKAEEHVEE